MMKYVFCMIVILMSGISHAQDRQWTLQECMLYAVENSTKIDKQEARNSIYRQNYREAVGNLLPSVSASTKTDFNFGRGVDTETNTYTNVNSFSNTYNLNSSVVLFDGFANIARIRMQKVNQLMGKEQLQQAKDMTAYETMQAFFRVLHSMEMVRLAESQLEESSANLKQVRRMEELGIKGFSDVAEMTAQEAANTYQLTQQRNALIIAVIQLKEKMNFPIEKNLEIADAVPTDTVIKSEESALHIFEQSRSFLPKATAAEFSLRVQELSYKSTKRRLSPTLSASAGYSTNFSRYMDGSDYTSFREQLKQKRGHYVGFSLSVPLFSGFSRAADIKRSKANVVIARADRDETLRTLHSEIEQAVADMNGQADGYAQAKKQVEAMQIAHAINQRKYTEGLVSAIELNTSANRLSQAKAAELNALLNYQLARKLVEYYKGTPFIVSE